MNLYQVLILFIDKTTERPVSAAADLTFAVNESLAFVELAVRIRANIESNGGDPDQFYYVPLRVARVSEQIISVAHTYTLAKSIALLQAHKAQSEYQLELISAAPITPRCVVCGVSGHAWSQCPALISRPAAAMPDMDLGGSSIPPGPFGDFFRSLDTESGDTE